MTKGPNDLQQSIYNCSVLYTDYCTISNPKRERERDVKEKRPNAPGVCVAIRTRIPRELWRKNV